MVKRTAGLVLAGMILLTVGCKDPQAPPAPTPVAATITETFSGTLAVGARISHVFTVQAVGDLNVSLVSVEPGAALGIGVGIPSGASCMMSSSLTMIPGPQAQLVGSASVTGPFCVGVFDSGILAEPVSYTISVFHS